MINTSSVIAWFEVNKTKVILSDIIKIRNYSDISRSQKWEEKDTRNPLPSSVWVAAITEYIYDNVTQKDIEDKYVKLVPTIKGSHNLMYINSLLSKFQIPKMKKTERELINQKFSKAELTEIVNNWILNRSNYFYDVAVDKAKKWLDQWYEWNSNNEVVKTANIKKVSESIIKRNLDRKFWEEGKFSEGLTKVEYKEAKGKIQQEDIATEIGNAGEKIFYDLLTNKYGTDAEIFWESQINKASAYDFRVIEPDGKEIYFEVKTTTKNYSSFILSRNEFEFYKKIKNEKGNYSVIVIKNLYLNEFENMPVIEEFKMPEFKINLDSYGYDGSYVNITPRSFKGRF